MNRTICIGLMALPVYLHNAKLSFAYSNVPSFLNPLSIVAYSTNAQSRIAPWQISARDDQTEDCLRDGMCRD
ncbi:hypothetical protein A6770_21595 [Nostoc minutum NIES-26]|uniref:Uncharacterized protein n=1 Tax=Nostoc minutum NIES-26 TaxID=1844469 RepID=A0A367R398_9NOSO|nr:hypothetical protein A6770_21595 [Nostoc minutum NIES-26]